MKRVILILGLALAVIIPSQAQKLGKFGGLTEKKIGPKTVKVPYTEVVSYLGYAAPNTEDEVIDGKKFYFIYLWVPAVAPELGVRMMSPVGKNSVKDAIVSEEYTANADSEDYFDTYITLERSDILLAEDVTAEKVTNADWITLAHNDDSSEMPKTPRGTKYNSLLRYKSVVGDPLKALTVGLYRIGFTTYKHGEVKGSFLAQVGAPVEIPGVVMAKTIEGLKAQMK
jgi:hypothetical protein